MPGAAPLRGAAPVTVVADADADADADEAARRGSNRLHFTVAGILGSSRYDSLPDAVRDALSRERVFLDHTHTPEHLRVHDGAVLRGAAPRPLGAPPQTVVGTGPLARCGLRVIPAEHAGNTNASAEEAECVAGLIRELA